VQVIATAGHVDHGKSTLVRALTGMDPDRWAEERRRGMTIDLGFAWMRLHSGTDVAFVDVPGHERFATNMLAGVGPVPATLLVIAADSGWGAQTEDHVRALDALGVSRGVLAVTRSDLANPELAMADALERLQETSLSGLQAVAVSGTTGEGLAELCIALERMVTSMPSPSANARVRLWVDRCFSIRGSGTVVTGTLPAGTVRQEEALELKGRTVTVRALQCLGAPVDEVSGVARLALNLRGVDRDDVTRGDALLTPGAWRSTLEVDVRLDAAEVPARLVVHVGAAAIPAEARVLGSATAIALGGPALCVRLRLASPVPLEVGDRLLLRDPGRRRIIGGARVLDPAPPQLRRRGAARERAASLRDDKGVPDVERELARRGVVAVELLGKIGVEVPAEVPQNMVRAGGWLVARDTWLNWIGQLHEVAARRTAALLSAGVTRADLMTVLALPSTELLASLVKACDDLEEVGGRVRPRGATTALRADLSAVVERLASSLRERPFLAPDQPQLKQLGLTQRELGAAAAARAILRLPGDVVLLPDAPLLAVERLRSLSQPFTLSAARQALDTSRRVAVPLLEHLDALRLTERVGKDLRRLRET
jgi:selenocysteine-specific elongation factor